MDELEKCFNHFGFPHAATYLKLQLNRIETLEDELRLANDALTDTQQRLIITEGELERFQEHVLQLDAENERTRKDLHEAQIRVHCLERTALDLDVPPTSGVTKKQLKELHQGGRQTFAIVESTKKSCAYCRKRAFCKQCIRCCSTLYCSSACQLLHWGDHSELCLDKHKAPASTLLTYVEASRAAVAALEAKASASPYRRRNNKPGSSSSSSPAGRRGVGNKGRWGGVKARTDSGLDRSQYNGDDQDGDSDGELDGGDYEIDRRRRANGRGRGRGTHESHEERRWREKLERETEKVHSMLEVVQGTTYIKEKEKEKRKERKKAAATHGPTKLSKREILLKKRKEELADPVWDLLHDGLCFDNGVSGGQLKNKAAARSADEP